MGVLEQVMDLKEKGVPENEIIGQLREEGIPPKQINDALGQAKIKSAVSSEKHVKRGMEPSIMGPEGGEAPPKELPTEGRVADTDFMPTTSASQGYRSQRTGVPASIDISNEEDFVPRPQGESYSEQEQYPQTQYPEEYSSQEYYPQEDYGYEGGGSDTDTLIEIAEQVFSEKMKPIQKQIEHLNEFKVLAQTKIDNISDRLKRIELSIDHLQSEILEKVGSYGRGLENVKKEMGMVQESFGKIVNTLADKSEHRHHHPAKTHTTHSKKSPVKKRATKSRTKKR